MKLDAVELLQEWVADIGAQAGLTPFNATISSGAVGVPESRLEVRQSCAPQHVRATLLMSTEAARWSVEEVHMRNNIKDCSCACAAGGGL